MYLTTSPILKAESGSMSVYSNPVVQTTLVSVVLVFLINIVVSVPLKAYIELQAKGVPAQIKSPFIMLLTRVLTPIALLITFRLIQDISTIGVAVPYLMSSIGTLQKTTGRTTADKNNITSSISNTTVARQTLIRVLTFMMVATFITLGMAGTGIKAVRNEVVKQVGF